MRYNNTAKIILILAAACAGAPQRGFAAKLDLSAGSSIKAVSHSQLNFASGAPSSQFFYIQNAYLSVIVKNIQPAKTSDTDLDVGIVFRSLGISGSTTTLMPPYNTIAERYPSSSFVPYVENAYIRANRIFDEDLILTAGRQPFILATGMALSDDSLGFTGLDLRWNYMWRDLSGRFFAFQPYAATPQSGSLDIMGFAAELPAEGLWQAYTFWEIDKHTKTLLNRPVSSVARQFSGISYALKHGPFRFDGEAAIERGGAKTSTEDIDFNGSAFILSGKWLQEMGKFGTGNARLAIGRGSGDSGSSPNTDEAFFPSFGHRYNGLERSGFGEVFGASLYDAMGGDTTTVTGMPSGLSGVQVFNGGITLPYKKVFIDIDYYSFEANTSSIFQKQLGNEWDIKVHYMLGEQLKLKVCYAFFNPGKAYPEGTPSPKKLSFEVFAKF